MLWGCSLCLAPNVNAGFLLVPGLAGSDQASVQVCYKALERGHLCDVLLWGVILTSWDALLLLVMGCLVDLDHGPGLGVEYISMLCHSTTSRTDHMWFSGPTEAAGCQLWNPCHQDKETHVDTHRQKRHVQPRFL